MAVRPCLGRRWGSYFCWVIQAWKVSWADLLLVWYWKCLSYIGNCHLHNRVFFIPIGTVLFLIHLMDPQTLTAVSPLEQYVSVFFSMERGLRQYIMWKFVFLPLVFVCRFLEFTRWRTVMSQLLKMSWNLGTKWWQRVIVCTGAPAWYWKWNSQKATLVSIKSVWLIIFLIFDFIWLALSACVKHWNGCPRIYPGPISWRVHTNSSGH